MNPFFQQLAQRFQQQRMQHQGGGGMGGRDEGRGSWGQPGLSRPGATWHQPLGGGAAGGGGWPGAGGMPQNQVQPQGRPQMQQLGNGIPAPVPQAAAPMQQLGNGVPAPMPQPGAPGALNLPNGWMQRMSPGGQTMAPNAGMPTEQTKRPGGFGVPNDGPDKENDNDPDDRGY
jgi:hypothetical protein